MNPAEASERDDPIVVKSVSFLSVTVAAIAGTMLSIVFFREIDRREAPPIIIEDPVTDGTIVVAVEGAVASPGLVSLSAGARWGDAIHASGGTLADADVSQVNAAARLIDGERLVIPTQGLSQLETVVTAGSPGEVISPAMLRQPTDAVLVNINRATATELDALPGIGPVLAERIVERRNEFGHFVTVDELVTVRGISEQMVDELGPLVTV